MSGVGPLIAECKAMWVWRWSLKCCETLWQKGHHWCGGIRSRAEKRRTRHDVDASPHQSIIRDVPVVMCRWGIHGDGNSWWWVVLRFILCGDFSAFAFVAFVEVKVECGAAVANVVQGLLCSCGSGSRGVGGGVHWCVEMRS